MEIHIVFQRNPGRALGIFQQEIGKGDMAVLNDECRACGRCVEICPSGALELSLDDNYVKDSIDFLSPIVDVT